ncbi:MAG TPA: helix-turn-helix transcriptional regulator [Bacilli bacterium]|nr:helix-turn-helix transcriptional regulator [Bacilli bacterium]
MALTASVNKETSVPQGRRICEIMEEKGDAYSLRALGRRIGMSKDMLHRCITGDRYIKPSELERIAEGLGISVARLLMEDVTKEREELKRLLTSMKNPKRALELAKIVAEPAVGVSERCEALNDLGRAYYLLHRYEEAHKVWLEAYPFAIQIQEKYAESTFLYHVVSNILLAAAMRKDYTAMLEIKSKALPALETHPRHAGTICYALAKIEEDLSNYSDAKTYYYEALNHFSRCDMLEYVAGSKHNIACFEFRRNNLKQSREFFLEALQMFPENTIERVRCHKELSKTLIRTGQLAEAEQHLRQALFHVDRCDVEDRDEYIAKINILLSRATSDPTYASHIAQDSNIELKYREVACNYLVHLYEMKEDAAQMIVWQRQLNQLSGRKYDVIDEEDM